MMNSVVFVLMCLLSILTLACGSSSSGGANDASSFSVDEYIDPHVLALAEALSDDERDPLTWAANILLPLDYSGAMRSPGGVIASFMGNDIDRCVTVRKLLSASDIPGRYAINGETCIVEAFVDGDVVEVPTSRAVVSGVGEGAKRSMQIPQSLVHQVQFIQRTWRQDENASGIGHIDHILGELDLPNSSSRPITVDFVETGDGIGLRLRIGREDASHLTAWTGPPLEDVRRADLIIRHVDLQGVTTDHHRTLFDRNSEYTNVTPDVVQDLYAIWISVNVVGEPYFRVEAETLGVLEMEGDREYRPEDFLRLRAIELAAETDYWAEKFFEETNIEGAPLFRAPRIIIAALEKRDPDSPIITPSLDLVSNTRAIIANPQSSSIHFALALNDAMAEGRVLERASGQPVMTVPTLFAALYQDEANDLVSRMQFFDESLKLLTRQGQSGSRLIFRDPDSAATATVSLAGTDLLLKANAQQVSSMRLGASDGLASHSLVANGLIIGSGPNRTLPIDLLLLVEGSDLTYVPRVVYIPEIQTGIDTILGTTVQGSGRYHDEVFEIQAHVRAFETPDPGKNSQSKRDYTEWQRLSSEGSVLATASTNFPSPSLTENKPDILQWGNDDGRSSRYMSPLWLVPSVVADIRAAQATEIRFVYKKDLATCCPTRQRVNLTRFRKDTQSISIDGIPMEIAVISASDESGDHQVVIAEDGSSRMVFRVMTPVGESVIHEVSTPAPLRFEGRVMSHRGDQTLAWTQPYAVGIPNARLKGEGLDILTWPDGSFSAPVPNSARPTLRGSIAVLVDTSGSMIDPVDPECAGQECVSKIEVVAAALEDSIGSVPPVVEFSVWGFTNLYGETCAEEIKNIAPLSLDWLPIAEGELLLNSAYTTRGTPLTGAVEGAITRMGSEARGEVRHLIVLADGDNQCDSPLQAVVIPSNLKIHTIGVGIEEGGAGERELMDLAGRSGGTYRRTTGGEELRDALEIITDEELVENGSSGSFRTTVSAANHLSKSQDLPVENPDLIVYLEEQPERSDRPKFVVIMPGDSFPFDELDLPREAISRIQEERQRRPDYMVIVPDRAVAIGHAPEVTGWILINPESGHTEVMTIDGLRGSVAFLGGLVTGMFAGVDKVLGGFSSCVLTEAGCGESLEEIKDRICTPAGSAHAGWMDVLNALVGELPFMAYFGQGGTIGSIVVEMRCSGEIQPLPHIFNHSVGVIGRAVPSGGLNVGYGVVAAELGANIFGEE
jgi:hypothetical protein